MIIVRAVTIGATDALWERVAGFPDVAGVEREPDPAGAWEASVALAVDVERPDDAVVRAALLLRLAALREGVTLARLGVASV